MKKTFSVLLFFMMAFYVFCHSGIFSGADIKIIKTKWFDIVYSQQSEKIASLLYDNADEIYEEISNQYGLEPSFRMSVVITDSVDIYNAFNTSVPYNRIVMYDTSSQKMDDLSSSISEPFLTTFRHELTHAVTFNMKNGFWNGVTKVFGDAFLPGSFFVTPGMAEGAAVASESMGGEGRLNDEFVNHFVKQAKIEDCFPSIYDVQGAAVTTIPSIHYYFNGPFHAYLQKKYGLDKYEDFWHSVLNLNGIGINWCFKKVFGISLRKEWKLFEESYDVPEVIKNPIENDIVDDFFVSWTDNSGVVTSENKAGARFAEIHNCDSGIFYSTDIFNDRSGQKIFFIPKNKLNDKDKLIKPETLFTHQFMDCFMPSADGRFLALSFYSTAALNTTAKIKIYDVENKQFFTVKEDGLKNGSIIKNDDDYYLVCHKYESPYNMLIIKKIVFENGKITGTQDIFSATQPFNNFVSNFIDLENGTFAFINKIGKDFNISISDLSGKIEKSYSLPEDVKIRELSFAKDSGNGGRLYFSWVKPGSMPRLGMLDIGSGLFSFSNVDISGGIFSPVEVGDKNNKRIAYIGRFYKENKLLTFDVNSKIITNSEKINNISDKELDTSDHNFIFTDISSTSLSQPYKSIENLHHGLLVPLSLYSANMIGENFGRTSTSQILPFGFTYVTANPWNGGNTSDDLMILSGGWSYLTNSIGFEAMLNQGTGTNLFSYKVDLKTEFDRQGWKQSGGQLVLGSGFHFGKSSSFAIQNDFKITGGRQNYLKNNINYLGLISFWNPDLFESFAPVNKNIALNVSDMILAKYSNIHSQGFGKFDLMGFSVGVGMGYVYDSVKGESFIVNSGLTVCLPRLIPVTERRGFTYNLPIRIGLSLFPRSSSYGLTKASPSIAKNSVLDANIEAILFGINIQKSIPFVEALFINEFYIAGGYNSTISSYKGFHQSLFQLPYLFEYLGNLGNGKSAYMDSVYLQFVLKMTPNIGLLAAPSGISTFSLYGTLSYPFNVIDESHRHLNFSFGIGVNF